MLGLYPIVVEDASIIKVGGMYCKAILIGHNGQGFDDYLVLEGVLKDCVVVTSFDEVIFKRALDFDTWRSQRSSI